jgi:hypothetical protein
VKIPKLAIIIGAVVLALVIVLVFFCVRSCQGPNEKYWMRVAVHEQAMKDAAAAHAASLEEIKVLQADNAAKVAENVTLKGTVVTQKGTIAALNRTIQELTAVEPPTTPAEEALPIVINLRARVAKLTEGFSLAQATIATQEKIIANLELVVKNTEKIADGWKTDYERSQGLLATERGLRIKAEKSGTRASMVAKVEAAIVCGAGAYFGGKALGHILKLW